MRLFLLTLSFLVSQQLLAYYPITPRPLRKLVKESMYIVRCRVTETGHETPKDSRSSFDNDYATVDILEVWQGRLTEKQVKVWFRRNLLCPAPGVLDDDEEALVFLDRDNKTKQFTIHALSYGVKHNLQEEGFALYKARVQEMQEILKIKDKEEQFDRTVEWLVTCAEQPITCWDGLYELSPGHDFMSAYDDDEDTQTRAFYLNYSQRRRLFDQMMKAERLDYFTVSLAELVRGVDDPALLDKLKKSLKQTDTAYLWEPGRFMYYIAEITRHPELKSLYERYTKLKYWEKDEEVEAREVLKEFIRVMEEARLPAPILSEDDVTG